MENRTVGKIKNVKYNSENNDLEVTISVTDSKFKKKLIRDLSLLGKLKFDGDNIVYNANTLE